MSNGEANNKIPAEIVPEGRESTITVVQIPRVVEMHQITRAELNRLSSIGGLSGWYLGLAGITAGIMVTCWAVIFSISGLSDKSYYTFLIVGLICTVATLFFALNAWNSKDNTQDLVEEVTQRPSPQ